MNQNILFDVANRLSRVEYEIDNVKFFASDVASLKHSNNSQHSAIVDLYGGNKSLHNEIVEIKDVISDINRRLIALEKSQAEFEEFKRQFNASKK